MAFKYKIDAVDADVKNMQASFIALNKYTESMRANTVQWRKYGEAITVAGRSARELQNISKTYSMTLYGTSDETARMGGVLKTVTQTFNRLSNDIKGISVHLTRILEGLMGFAMFSGLSMIMGLAGFGGGMFGLREASAAVASRRREAMGLGTSYGAYSSFGVAFGRYGDTGGLLGNTFTGMYDVMSPQSIGLFASGVTREQIERGDTADIAATQIRNIPRLLGNLPEGSIMPTARGLHLTDTLSPQQILRALHSSPSEREEMIKTYQKGKLDFALSPEAQKKWTDFAAKIDLAGRKIETVFAKKFVALEPVLEKLSTLAVDLLTTLLNSKPVSDSIKALKDQLIEFSKSLASDDFKQAMKEWLHALDVALPLFGRIMKGIARAVWPVIRYIFDDSYSTLDLFVDLTTLLEDQVLPPLPPEEKRLSTWMKSRRPINRPFTPTPTYQQDPSAPAPQREQTTGTWPASDVPPAVVSPGPEGAEEMSAWRAHKLRDDAGPWYQGIKWKHEGPNTPLQPDLKESMRKLERIHGPYTVNWARTGGHVAGSQHWKGEAIDINTTGMNAEEYTQLITDAAKAGFHRFGISTTHLHADMGATPDGRIMTFPDQGVPRGGSYAGRSVNEWSNYLNGVIGNRVKELPKTDPQFYHPRWQHKKTSYLDHYQDHSRLPKAVVVENNTGSANTINVQRVAFG